MVVHSSTEKVRGILKMQDEERKPVGAFEPGTFTGSSNGCLVWMVPIIGVAWVVALAASRAASVLMG